MGLYKTNKHSKENWQSSEETDYRIGGKSLLIIYLREDQYQEQIKNSKNSILRNQTTQLLMRN